MFCTLLTDISFLRRNETQCDSRYPNEYLFLKFTSVQSRHPACCGFTDDIETPKVQPTWLLPQGIIQGKEEVPSRQYEVNQIVDRIHTKHILFETIYAYFSIFEQIIAVIAFF